MAAPSVTDSIGNTKTLLSSGRGALSSFPDGTKATFHYLTTKPDGTVIDDSRKSQPMELIMGKKFKFEIWETIVKSMRVGEVAKFLAKKEVVSGYPIISKSLRDIHHKKGHHKAHHCCGMVSDAGLGYPDLDELLKNPQDLEFTIELLKVEEPGEYKKDTWVMSEDEKLDLIPKLKEEGNQLYKGKEYSEASEKYAQALGLLEQLLLKEKPGDTSFKELEDRKIPLLLNYSQCKLFMEDFYQVIEHTTTVLEKQPENVKALFRRGKAHVAVWKTKEARDDFTKVIELDPSLEKLVQKEIKNLDELQRQKDKEDREKLQGKMFT